jgi:crossover junction endodeoxyribonuclease RusA
MTEEQYSAHRIKRAAELAKIDGHSRGPHHEWIVLPWPPTANTNVRHAEGAHYLTDEHKEFRAEVARRVNSRSCRHLVGRLRVSIAAFPPDKRRRDLDNAIKPILDACQHAGLYADDEQIDEISILRVSTPGAACGSVSVTIAEIA